MALSVGFHYRHTGSLTRLRSYSHQMGLMGNAQRSVCVVYSVIHKSANSLYPPVVKGDTTVYTLYCTG